jgi:hypothetical protein
VHPLSEFAHLVLLFSQGKVPVKRIGWAGPTLESFATNNNAGVGFPTTASAV